MNGAAVAVRRRLPRATPVLALALALAAALVPARGAFAQTPLPCDPANLPRQALQAINLLRAAPTQCGALSLAAAPPLAWSDLAARAAALHADDMARRDQMGHYGSDGSLAGQRLTQAGYAWGGWGENLGQGQTELSELLAQWMASDGHCANLMHPRMTEFGIACRQRDGQDPFWALTLARPSRQPPPQPAAGGR